MKASGFIAASAGIMFLLGLVHLLYTFRGSKLRPGDPDLLARMTTVSPGISSETTMWRAWVGFNASHSLCLIFFGVVYGYLATRQSAFLFHSWFLLAVGLVFLLSYVALARLYWFSAPFRGVALATVFYAVGVVLSRK